MPRADDRRVVRIRDQRGIEACNSRLELISDDVSQTCRHEYIVRSNAGLSGIQEFAVGNARDGSGYVAGRIDYCGRFSAELQRHRRKVRRGSLSDLPADLG